ncbi:hypothetical protein AURDEDRAFT_164740 [Auricularia subglabra TFB-10046 SS5]|nr:hypothetical protein AURDEDRAFT_164740 [Auricularia subglabra TFB-10046 SS5]
MSTVWERSWDFWKSLAVGTKIRMTGTLAGIIGLGYVVSRRERCVIVNFEYTAPNGERVKTEVTVTPANAKTIAATRTVTQTVTHTAMATARLR